MSSTISTVLSASDSPGRIAEAFTALLNRAQELFVGLYDLPTYSSPAVWKPYFQRAFSSFTRLWKFQQLHRVVLEREDVCGLKRHEVGEIASKIGQLYYNYYTRTSETGYLLDAYTFFEAVWDRKYFDKVMETRLPSVASKRLRFCARFMIVCLLLNRWDRVQVLVVEMKRYVDLFAEVLDPMDKDGWRKTYTDMAALVDTLSRSAHGTNAIDRPPLNLRLPALDASMRESATRGLIGEAVICCSWPDQVKFSDFSVDLYRVHQTLERDPVKCNPNDIKDPDCPRKYSLYMPSVSNILAHMSCSLKELLPSQFLLFYFSGPGAASYTPTPTTSGTSPTSSSMPPLSPGPTSIDLMQCGLDMRAVPPGAEANHDDRLHVTDLLAYLRRPFVGVIDSPAAHVFRKVPKIYSAPFMFFMSPQEHPAQHKDLDTRRNGSLFTSFLAHPVVALADLCQLSAIDTKAWDTANQVVRQWHEALVETLVKHSDSPKLILDLANDDYMQRLVVRFIICRVVLTHHVHFVKTTELPCCHPDLPDVLWTDLEVISRDQLSKVLQVLDIQSQFR